MDLTQAQIISLVIASSFAAGLNVYAMLATLGFLGHFHVVQLPPSLQTVENPWIIAVSVALFVLHFFADKIPAFDLVWNALNTFVRIPVAALVAYAATSQLSPEAQIASTATGLRITQLWLQRSLVSLIRASLQHELPLRLRQSRFRISL